MNNIIVGIGEALWDILPEGKKLGGAPANFAFHVSQFGLKSYAVSAVGNDALGDEIVNNFTAKGLNQHISRVEFPTGTVFVELDDNGIPQYDIKENVAWDNIPYTPQLESLAQNTIAVCFGSLAQRNDVSRCTIKKFLNAMQKSDDTLIVFDINLRQNYYTKALIDESMQHCNSLKINDEELITVCQMFNIPDGDIEEQCKTILNHYNLRMLILTCGTNGSYVFSRNEVSFQPTPKVVVADTVGAGDSFTASFIASIIRGKSIRDAHAIAVKTSAFVCTQNGAMPILPNDLTA